MDAANLQPRQVTQLNRQDNSAQMANAYVHIELETAQSPKRPHAPCGDVFACDRTAVASTIVCADGIGSGIRARIAAQMCVSRVLQLVKLGFSLRKAMASVVGTMQANRDPSRPFTAFSVARIMNDGIATIFSYDAPTPILVSRYHAAPLPVRTVEMNAAIVNEADCWLEPGDGLLLMTDGVTQAGLGSGLAEGWRTEGAAEYINHCLTNGSILSEIPELVHDEARRLSTRGGDDCTILLAHCRRGQVVNLLTGPPQDHTRDREIVNRFIKSPGKKIVCGGTTSEIVSRTIGKKVIVDQESESMIAPPRYDIEGIDLVTEGVVTLNQVYNLLDEPPERLVEDSGVTELCRMLRNADRINFFVGGVQNRANGNISFRQQGILTRDRILPLITEKLRTAEKLVVIEYV
jgi:hypothetical protein